MRFCDGVLFFVCLLTGKLCVKSNVYAQEIVRDQEYDRIYFLRSKKTVKPC